MKLSMLLCTSDCCVALYVHDCNSDIVVKCHKVTNLVMGYVNVPLPCKQLTKNSSQNVPLVRIIYNLPLVSVQHNSPLQHPSTFTLSCIDLTERFDFLFSSTETPQNASELGALPA